MTEAFRPQINIGLPSTTPPVSAYDRLAPRREASPEPTAKKYHKEPAIPGETLNNYTTKVPSEDGKYVKITSHTERIELIKQPPTPEEIAERKRLEEEEKAAEKKFLRIVGGILGGFLALVFGMAWYDERQHRNGLVRDARAGVDELKNRRRDDQPRDEDGKFAEK